MGREKTILLSVLGLLAGVFVGALSLKLLVPRPPAGAGPDLRAEATTVTTQERVEPPQLTGWNFAAAPPLVPDDAAVPASTAATPHEAAVADPPRFGRFAPPAPPEAAPEAPAAADAVTASWEQDPTAAAPSVAPAGPARDALPGHDVPGHDMPDHRLPPMPAASPPPRRFAPAAALPLAEPAPAGAGLPSRDPFAAATAAAHAAPVAGAHMVAAGESWWQIAERAYGDGRFYRALFAWNRARDPRISLAPGTRLDVPPPDRLRAAWPRLAPPAGR